MTPRTVYVRADAWEELATHTAEVATRLVEDHGFDAQTIAERIEVKIVEALPAAWMFDTDFLPWRGRR